MSTTIDLDSGWAVTRYSANRQSYLQITMPTSKRPHRLKGAGYDSLSPSEALDLTTAILELTTLICPDTGKPCPAPNLCRNSRDCDVPF